MYKDELDDLACWFPIALTEIFSKLYIAVEDFVRFSRQFSNFAMICFDIKAYKNSLDFTFDCLFLFHFSCSYFELRTNLIILNFHH